MARRTQNKTGREKLTFERSALNRQWRILNILGYRENGVTVKELANEFQSSQRTIQRDLDLLQSIGFPLEPTTGPHGRKYWSRKAGLIPSINLTLTEAAAIYLGRKLMEPLAGTDLWVGAQEAYHKFQSAFDQPTLKYLDRLAQAFHPTRFGIGDYSNYGETIDTLMISIEDRKVVSLGYQSQATTEPVTRDVHPYHLVYHKGTLYLVAWAVERGAFRNYKVDRISTAIADAMSLPFIPVEFNLEDYLAGSFGIYQGQGKPVTVKIRFQQPVVRYVEEKRWHDSEKLTRQPDGTLIAEFQLTSFEEVKGWVLSFGHQAEILEPQALREEVAVTIRSMLGRYETIIDQHKRTTIKRSRPQ